MKLFVISKYKGQWKVNSSTYGYNSNFCNQPIINDTVELITPYKPFKISNQKIVKKSKSDVFRTLNAAKAECDKRNILPKNDPSEICYDYIDNPDGSQTVYYMDDDGNESEIKVW